MSCERRKARARPGRPAPSAHAELALQAGRGRRVLESQLLVRIDVMVRPLGGERGFVEAAQDQLQLAGIGD